MIRGGTYNIEPCQKHGLVVPARLPEHDIARHRRYDKHDCDNDSMMWKAIADNATNVSHIINLPFPFSFHYTEDLPSEDDADRCDSGCGYEKNQSAKLRVPKGRYKESTKATKTSKPCRAYEGSFRPKQSEI